MALAEIQREGFSAGWSTEARSLLKPHDTLGIPIPAYAGRGLTNLAATVFRVVLPNRAADDLDPSLRPELNPFPEGSAPGPVVIFLVDGLGWFAYSRWLASAQVEDPRIFPGSSRPITTVFPTTTTCALASLATGVAPARHGLVGYRQYVPRYGAVVDMLKMMPVGSTKVDSLVDADWHPEIFCGQPTLFRRGLDGVALSRDRFQGSGLTRLIYDGAEYVAYGTASDLARLLAQLLERPRPPPRNLRVLGRARHHSAPRWAAPGVRSVRNGPARSPPQIRCEAPRSKDGSVNDVARDQRPWPGSDGGSGAVENRYHA